MTAHFCKGCFRGEKSCAFHGRMRPIGRTPQAGGSTVRGGMPESKTAEHLSDGSGVGSAAAFAWRSLVIFSERTDRMYAYCLFCETQRCKTIAYLLERFGVVERAFSPQIIKRARVKGKYVDKPYDLLPGYVFLFSETPLEDFAHFYGIKGILRRIGDPEKSGRSPRGIWTLPSACCARTASWGR